MRRRFFFSLLVGLYALALGIVCAEDAPPVITVTKSSGQIGLTLNPLSGGEGPAATKTLTEDLNNAGAFALSVGQNPATYTARGSAAGGSLQGTLVSRDGAALLNKTYSRPDAHGRAPVRGRHRAGPDQGQRHRRR